MTPRERVGQVIVKLVTGFKSDHTKPSDLGNREKEETTCYISIRSKSYSIFTI